MYLIRKSILAFALAFVGFNGANAQEMNVTPEEIANAENPASAEDLAELQNYVIPESLAAPGHHLSPQRNNAAENRIFLWQFRGTATAPKFIVQRFDFEPRFSFERIFGVRLIGLDQVVDVRQVQLVLRNGQIFNLNNLEGFLREGRVKRVFLNGVRIRELRVWATSPNPIGSRGDFRVDFLVWR